MTFGTVMGSSTEAKAIFRAALDAVGSLKVAALMTTGPTMEVQALGSIPKNIVLRNFVPQYEVFAHLSAVLCHGGSGTVLGALASGLPLVVTPIGADQPENASAVEAVGAGLAVDTPDAGSMANALNRILTEAGYAAAAKRVAAEVLRQIPAQSA
jgi:UDP:flavonoid glycosyltransferase YjiC (YdhE family)